jgi:hypothetical protein
MSLPPPSPPGDPVPGLAALVAGTHVRCLDSLRDHFLEEPELLVVDAQVFEMLNGAVKVLGHRPPHANRLSEHVSSQEQLVHQLSEAVDVEFCYRSTTVFV